MLASYCRLRRCRSIQNQDHRCHEPRPTRLPDLCKQGHAVHPCLEPGHIGIGFGIDPSKVVPQTASRPGQPQRRPLQEIAGTQLAASRRCRPEQIGG